jgi:surface antigen
VAAQKVYHLSLKTEHQRCTRNDHLSNPQSKFSGKKFPKFPLAFINFIRRITMKSLSIVALLFLLVLSSCATKGQTGALGGAAGGALIGQAIGGNTGATLIGAAVGGALGYIIGNEMDKSDRDQLNRAYEQGPSNQRSSWVNPDSGNSYAVTPQPAYNNPSSRQVCRKAEIDAVIDGKRERTYSTACRNSSGQWELQQ